MSESDMTREHVDSLNEQAWELRTSDLARMRELATQAHDLAQTLEYPEGIAYSLVCLARADHYDGKNEAALTQLLEAINLLDRYTIQGKPYILALLTKGMIFNVLEHYAEVLAIYLELLRIAQETDQTDYQIVALNAIGVCHSHLGEYQQALGYYEQALALCVLTSDRQMEGVIYANRALEYRALEDYSAALQAGFTALEIFRSIPIDDLAVSTLINLGETYRKMGDDTTALHYFQEAVEQASRLSINAQKYSLHALLNRGGIYRRQAHWREAETDLQQAMGMAEQASMRSAVALCHEQLADLYQQQGDFERALGHYRLFHQVREEVFNARAAEKTRLLMIIHQTEAARQEAQYYQLQTKMLKAQHEQERYYFQQMMQMKDDLIHTASHDLKNPLGAIQIFTDLLRTRFPKEMEPVQQYLDRIEIQVRRMRALIEDLLDLAALDAQPTLMEPVSVSAVLQEVVTDFMDAAQQKHIHLIFQPTSLDGYVVANPPQIKRAFQNLLSNAIKYTPDQGKVTISIAAKPTGIGVSIEDTGIGIPEEELPYIFDKFYRVKDVRNSHIEGTGLGLAIVKKIIDHHQGTIQVTSHFQEGSQFEIILPRWRG